MLAKSKPNKIHFVQYKFKHGSRYGYYTRICRLQKSELERTAVTVEISLMLKPNHCKKNGCVAICRADELRRWPNSSSVASRQHLRSSSRGLLVVPCHRLSSYGLWAFSVASPAIWNWLPDSLRDPAISRDSFKRSLKTFLFSAYSCT